MPVYNGEKTIQNSLNSLLRQGDTAIEVIAVNDCSTDHTQDVLEKFAINAPSHIRVKIIKHEVNGGVARARNTALDHASGKYILWLDADDYYSVGAFDRLLAQPEADIISYSYFLQYESTQRVINVPQLKTPWEAFTLMAEGKLKWNLWAFMVRRDLIEDHHIRFIPGHNMGEDLYFMGHVMLYAKTTQTLTVPLYHYITFNSGSLTNNYRPKHFEDMQVNIKALEDAIITHKGPEVKEIINHLKLTLKLPLLYSKDSEQYKIWQGMFQEANESINTYPTPHTYNQWLQQWAKRGQFMLIKLFNYLYTFVYSIRYR